MLGCVRGRIDGLERGRGVRVRCGCAFRRRLTLLLARWSPASGSRPCVGCELGASSSSGLYRCCLASISSSRDSSRWGSGARFPAAWVTLRRRSTSFTRTRSCRRSSRWDSRCLSPTAFGRLMWPLVCLGLLLGVYMLWQVTAYPVGAQPEARCIDYTTHAPNDVLSGVLYVAVTCGPALMSSPSLPPLVRADQPRGRDRGRARASR